MTARRRPRAITFDFWMTLFQDASGPLRQEMRVKAFMQAAGTPEAETRAAFEIWPRLFYETHIQEQRTLTPRDAVDIACRELGVSLEEKVIQSLTKIFAAAILDHPPVPVAGALEAVTRAAQYVPVGIISDTGISPGASLRTILARHGMEHLFGVLTFSDEVGVAKPQRPMFERTARALGVDPADILHIGDLEPTDIVGIQQVGGIGALFAGANDRFRDATQAEYTFDNWVQFIDTLPALFGHA